MYVGTPVYWCSSMKNLHAQLFFLPSEYFNIVFFTYLGYYIAYILDSFQ